MQILWVYLRRGLAYLGREILTYWHNLWRDSLVYWFYLKKGPSLFLFHKGKERAKIFSPGKRGRSCSSSVWVRETDMFWFFLGKIRNSNVLVLPGKGDYV